MINSVRQGHTFEFDFGISGSDVEAFATTFSVMQYPSDTPAITRGMDYYEGKFIGTLTALETTDLAVGQWFIYPNAVDADEDLGEPIKLYVAKGWV